MDYLDPQSLLKRPRPSGGDADDSLFIPRKRNILEGTYDQPDPELNSTGFNLACTNEDSDVPTDNYVPRDSQLAPTCSNFESQDEAVEVCYGMVHGRPQNPRERFNTADRPKKFPDHDYFSRIVTGSFNTQRFVVSSRAHYYALQSDHQNDFAVLHCRTANALRALSDLSPLRFEAVLVEDRIAKQSEPWKQKGNTAGIPVSLHLYGARSIAPEVGRRLSKAHIYLQHPSHLEDRIEYDNPHYFKIPGRQTRDPFPPPIPAIQAKPVHHQGLDIAEILENPEQDQALQSENANWRIRTALLKHQKKALHFMLRRETANIDDSFSLWKISTSGLIHCYEHIIIKSKSITAPYLAQGGILADDMGLGKTLTTISTIVLTLDDAQRFASAAQTFNKSICINACQRIKSTLVVVPSHLLLDCWVDQIQSHVVAGTLKFHKYHGTGKSITPETLVDFDVVLTTYATLGSDVSRDLSTLNRFAWFRIVLDEAHVIRHQNTKQFRSVFSLSAERRWCLTGTPIQNRLEDIGSLIKFLRITPFDSNSEFRRHILDPLTLNREGCDKNLRLLLGSVFLRRTRRLLQVPEAKYETLVLSLSAEEKLRYSRIVEESKRRIDDSISSKALAKAYNGILQVILRLRILCSSGTMTWGSDPTLKSDAPDLPALGPEEMLTITKEGDKLTCAFCSYEMEIMDVTNDTSSESLPARLHLVCPACLCQNDVYVRERPLQNRKRHSAVQPPDQNIHSIGSSHITCPPMAPGTQASSDSRKCPIQGYSSKMTGLVGDIKQHLREDKSIVFSCWKATLDVLEPMLLGLGIKYVRIDGDVSNIERSGRVKQFQEDPWTNVLLMTTGTGAAGLNLTAATRVHLLEPQWNPAVEAQAIGRAVRLGQSRSVTIIRYIMQDTIEKAIQSRQIVKLQLAEMTLDKNDKNAESMLGRLQELRSLLE